MKRVLIISPHFPPVNSADMHRVRQSLPYLKEFGWEPVVIAVDEVCVEAYSLDELLLQTIPEDIEVHKVQAFDVRKTRKFGLGSLSMRSYFHIQKKGDQLLKERKFDLVYFSTTAFHVMALGPRWKKKFGVPYILDMQDPWRSDFYLDKPKAERPPKFFISYNIDKYLEGKALPKADGIISVSKGYCDMFMQRYPVLKPAQFKVITFGASYFDFEVMERYVHNSKQVKLSNEKINVVYIGRGGHDLQFSLNIIFGAFAKGIQHDPAIFSKFHFWFIGTSYAPPGQGQKTVLPIAINYNVQDHVTEITDRLPYFETLFILKKADLLLVPGSTDTTYTASKIYPYLVAEKPLLAVFYKESSVINVLTDVQVGQVIAYDHLVNSPGEYVDSCLNAFKEIYKTGMKSTQMNTIAFEPYTAKAKTLEQIEFFNQITG
jgi:glycosyltransferase involved in cell wall biosynthesis